MKYVAVLIFLCMFFSCSEQSHKELPVNKSNAINIQYARGFTISDKGSYYTLIVRDPLDTAHVLETYYLVRRGASYPAFIDEKNKIEIPITDLACLSTTHLGFLEALHQENKLIAFSGTKYIYNEALHQAVQTGKIAEAGNEGDLNTELLIRLQPDIIMAYNTGDPDYDHFAKLQSLKLHPVLNNEYLELTPLGEAEWIKYTAVFFDDLAKADHIFDSVVREYNSIKQAALQLQQKPEVFTGMAFKGEWTIPGGKSFAANYLNDAGASYLWNDDTRTGNYAVSLEEVMLKAAEADFWLHAGAADDLEDILSADDRYSVFKAFRNKNVYNNNKRVNANGGNDYWESGVISPQLILQDLITIFHPESSAAHKLIYYKKLE